MKTNVGGLDRAVRVAGGLALMVLAALDVIGVWGWLGVIPLLAGLFRYCPLYSLLGISSCSGNCKR